MPGMAKAIFTCSGAGRSSMPVRLNMDPASNVFGGATGVTWMMRSFLPDRTMRSSSGIALTWLFLPRRETAPSPVASTPAPEIDPVVMSPSTNGISAAWTDPATDFSTKEFQRALDASMPETRLAMS